jgi:hypothetical protein
VPRQDPNRGVLALAAALRAGDRRVSAAVRGFVSDPAGAAQDPAIANPLADQLANDANVGKLQLFAGFLGGTVKQDTDPTHKEWQLLYLDPKLFGWLLVDVAALLVANNVEDPRAAFGSYDYIWLSADASVSQGEGALQANEIEARFLRGDFVSAADFAAAQVSGTYAPTTGPSCPITPGCCGIRTR